MMGWGGPQEPTERVLSGKCWSNLTKTMRFLIILFIIDYKFLKNESKYPGVHTDKYK